jgi:uncharacterized protein with beta-barrel porin domain
MKNFMWQACWSLPKSPFAVATATSIAVLMGASDASAQLAPPVPIPFATDNNIQFSATAAQFDLSSSFLQRLARQATYGFALRDSSGGGGASQTTADPLYRVWGESYGLTSRTGPQGTFIGDRRNTFGGVAGIGATIAPGLNIGFSVDQSRTDIDVPLAFQSATLDMTQLGINAAYNNGPWTVAIAAVHGFAQVDTRRATIIGTAVANYGGKVDGVLGELNYTFSFGQSRIVPKVALEYVSAVTDGFQETSGTHPITTTEAAGERARVLVGAEVGHYWIIDQQAVDVSAYGKFVDNFSQNIGDVQVGLSLPGAKSINVQGVLESMYGADAGASVSYILSNTARLYANYDGKFRDGFTSHQGTLGVELKW